MTTNMKCNHPGCKAIFTTAQQLGTHKFRMHGIRGVHAKPNAVAGTPNRQGHTMLRSTTQQMELDNTTQAGLGGMRMALRALDNVYQADDRAFWGVVRNLCDTML